MALSPSDHGTDDMQLSQAGKANVVAAVIPCYREKAHILAVLGGIGTEVDRIYVVDDACPDKTGLYVRENCIDERVTVLTNPDNKGVGGATLTGYRQALDDGASIIVKLDGDGQMNPANIPALIAPIRNGETDYAKGNRFHSLEGVTGMPVSRIFGNFVLSFASKLSSGYWNIFDPTNGFTAIHATAAERLPLEKISEGYFFESDMLFHLGLLRAVVVDVPMHARYGAETSGIRIPKVVPEFVFKHYMNACKRIFFTYLVRETNVATAQLIFGKLLLLFGIVFGAVNWIESETTGVNASAGTVVLAALPIIIGSQLMIAFLAYDTRNVPSDPIQERVAKSSEAN